MPRLLKYSVEELIALAQYGGKNRLIAAKEVAFLRGDVDLDKLLWLINILSSDTESIEFSELGVSLGRLIEKMDLDRVVRLIEELLKTRNGRRLLVLMLSNTNLMLDVDFLSEIIRRMLMDSDDEVRNGGLAVLKKLAERIDYNASINILYDFISEENAAYRNMAIDILLTLSDILKISDLEEALFRLLDDENRDIVKRLIRNLDMGVMERLSRRTIVNLINKVKNMNDPSMLSEFLIVLERSDRADRDMLLEIIKEP